MTQGETVFAVDGGVVLGIVDRHRGTVCARGGGTLQPGQAEAGQAASGIPAMRQDAGRMERRIVQVVGQAHAAETGIAALQNDFQYAGEINGSLGEGSYNVTFTAINNQQRDIIALAVLKGYSKKLRITMELIEADGEDAVLIRQWHKAVSQ